MAEGTWSGVPTAIAPPDALTGLVTQEDSGHSRSQGNNWAQRLPSMWSYLWKRHPPCVSSIQLLNRKGSKVTQFTY